MVPYRPPVWPSLVELFLSTVERHPDRPCFTAYDEVRQSLTYSQARSKVAAVAVVLQKASILPGDKVALTGANSPEWAVAYLGILAVGAVVVPIDHQLKPEEALRLYEAGDCVAFFADGAKHSAFQAGARGARFVGGLDPDQSLSVANLDPTETPLPPLRPSSELAAILFTSGTTGQPKGVMLTHANLSSDCFLSQVHLNIFPSDVFYALLPLHHSYTMLAVFIEAISVGAEIVFARKLAVTQLLKDFKQAGVTMFLAVPLLFNKLLGGILDGVRKKGPIVYGLIRLLMAVSGFVKRTTGVNPGKKIFRGLLDAASLATMRICISGGGPLAPSVFRQYNQLGLDFVQGYGLTETSPILALNPVAHYKVTSVGKLIPEVELQILDADETGQGEIVVRGPMVMKGYYRNPVATAAVLGADGWLRTGDVGRIDSENYLTITGRCKSLIVTEGGKNVYPEEIEFAFQLHEEVDQVLVRGFLLDAELRSEGIEALIYPSTEHQGKPEADLRHRFQKIIDQVNSTLLPYQRISRFVVLEEPMAMTTKRTVKRSGAQNVAS
jgi:long-chain acyl-CoA synthetase